MQISFSQKLYTCTVKRLFRWELPASGRGIHCKNGILQGITRSLTWKSTRWMEFRRDPLASGRGIHRKIGIPPGLLAHEHRFWPARSKIFRSVTIPETLTLKDLYRIRLIFKNLNMNTSLKWKIILIRLYYELNIYLMKPLKRTQNIHETIPLTVFSLDCAHKIVEQRELENVNFKINMVLLANVDFNTTSNLQHRITNAINAVTKFIQYRYTKFKESLTLGHRILKYFML
jgi:hypothetical protein